MAQTANDDPSCSVSIIFSQGWCTLVLTAHRQRHDAKATGIAGHDPFADLVSAVGNMASGAAVQTCAWPAEPGGMFLEFAQDRAGVMSIVWHEFGDKDSLTIEPPWMPSRGPIITQFTCPAADLIRAFTREFAAAADLESDGIIVGWGKPFPKDPYARLVGEA